MNWEYVVYMKVIEDRKEIKIALFSGRCGLRAVLPWAVLHATCFGEYSEMENTFRHLVLPMNSRGFKGKKNNNFLKNLNFKFRQK